VIALEVEALGRRVRHARGLLGQEVDDAELGHVLAPLVELDAERVGVRVRHIGLEARLLQRADEWDRPVVRRNLRTRRRRQRQHDRQRRHHHEPPHGEPELTPPPER
jgi:hypothetical protein